MAGQVQFNHYWSNQVLLAVHINKEVMFEASYDFKYMRANMSNMNKYDYSPTQIKSLTLKVKQYIYITHKNRRYSTHCSWFACRLS